MEESTTTTALVMSLRHVVVEIWPFGLPHPQVGGCGFLDLMMRCKLYVYPPGWHFHLCHSCPFIIAGGKILAYFHMHPEMPTACQNLMKPLTVGS